MNIKILAQNIINNPKDFTAEKIEKYFEDYVKFSLSNKTELIPLYDVDELNEIVKKFNNKEIALFEFISLVWNTAYNIGRDDFDCKINTK